MGNLFERVCGRFKRRQAKAPTKFPKINSPYEFHKPVEQMDLDELRIAFAFVVNQGGQVAPPPNTTEADEHRNQSLRLILSFLKLFERGLFLEPRQMDHLINSVLSRWEVERRADILFAQSIGMREIDPASYDSQTLAAIHNRCRLIAKAIRP